MGPEWDHSSLVGTREGPERDQRGTREGPEISNEEGCVLLGRTWSQNSEVASPMGGD